MLTGFLKMNALAAAVENWKYEEVVVLPPIEPSIVTAKFRKIGRQCSNDVLALYAATGGMEDGESDSHLWSLWSLEKVISETSRYSRPYILFADFSINSHLYCFKYENEEESSVRIDYVNGEEPELVAGSVEEFFHLFNRDAGKLRMFG
jgi:hypothetical protein